MGIKISYYQCYDMRTFYHKEGGMSCRDEGASDIQAILNNPNSNGAFLYTPNGIFIVKDGTLFPVRSEDLKEFME